LRHLGAGKVAVGVACEPMSAAVAPDDIVTTHDEVPPDGRPPLLVLDPLRHFLDAHGLGSGDIRAQPIGEGHSNVTYLIERDHGPELVLRRPPRPPLPPSAHDVLREARLLKALAPTPARVPRVLAVCDDETVLDTPEQRRRIGEQLIEALVEIHAVDWQAAGLEGFGKPTGYLERQLRRFGGLWDLNKTRDIPAVERVGAWLAEHMPQSGPATIVHGDYRLGNTMFAATAPAQLVAVFDWEMATIGDPLADLGYLCMFWTEASDPEGGLREHLGKVTRAEGYPTRAELIDRYESLTGRSMKELRWYTTLALWKSVVFMEGNYKRAIAGTTDDPYLKQFGEGVLELARQAEAVAHGE
jgi:aminoglycoside phosphotransferase (APT) family kinase protein